MKNIFLLIILLSISSFSIGQNNSTLREDAKKLTTPLVAKYGLTHFQEAKMLKIQERKLKNSSAIEVYKNTDQLMYYKKKKSIQEGTDFSITKLLDKKQLEIYKKERAELRLKRANTEKMLREKGVSGFDLDKALIDIE